MKLSEYRDGEALDLLAELIEPVASILADNDISALQKDGASIAKIASAAIKGHKEEVLRIMAALDGVPFEEYHCNILTLPKRLIEILNDKDLQNFFSSQGQTEEPNSSGSASATTKARKK